MYTLDEKVEAGAQLLDLTLPGWANRVDTRTLNMESVNDCILGQCFPYYSYGKKALGIQFGEGFGFVLTGHDPTGYDRRMAWERLRKLWLEEIEMRILAEDIAASDDIPVEDAILAEA